jgi:hypothetical protein
MSGRNYLYTQSSCRSSIIRFSHHQHTFESLANPFNVSPTVVGRALDFTRGQSRRPQVLVSASPRRPRLYLLFFSDYPVTTSRAGAQPHTGFQPLCHSYYGHRQ